METTVWDPAISQPISVTPAICRGVVHEMLMGADSAAKLPRLMHRAVTENDWDAVAEIYMNRILPQQRASAGLVMYAVIRCSEPWAMGRLDEVARNGQNSYGGDVAAAQATSQWLRPAHCCPNPNRMRCMVRHKNRMCRCWC